MISYFEGKNKDLCDVKYFQVEEVGADLQLVKGEQCIVMRTRDAKIVLTNAVSEFFSVSTDDNLL